MSLNKINFSHDVMSDKDNFRSCLRCGRTFSRSYDMKRHYNRKHNCPSMWYQAVESGEVKVPEGITSEMEEWFHGRWNQMELKLWSRVENFIDRLQQNYLGQNKRINGQISLPLDNRRNGFGSESLQHLSSNDIEEILHSGKNILTTILKKVYFNEIIPENANVFCPNYTRKVLMVWEQDNSWHRVSFEDWWSSWITQVENWIERWTNDYGDNVDMERIINMFDDIRYLLDWNPEDSSNEEKKAYTNVKRRVNQIQRGVFLELSYQKDFIYNGNPDIEESSDETDKDE